MRNRFAVGMSICALASAASGPAHAWGDEGHEVVGLIAEHYLMPQAKQKAEALLAGDTTNLIRHDTGDAVADEATWADRYRDQDNRTLHYRQTQQWHFVDLELSKADLVAACFGRATLHASVPASKGPANDCVVNKIEQFTAELSNPATPTDERRMALQFLLHFIGDVHQPLHASDDHDRGGNDKTVSATGMGRGKLHAFWDVQFVEAQGSNARTIAAALIKQISPSDQTKWSATSPETWANESYDEARTVAYGKLPSPSSDGSYALNDTYVASAKQAVSLQLRRAGVRLAAALNKALGQ